MIDIRVTTAPLGAIEADWLVLGVYSGSDAKVPGELSGFLGDRLAALLAGDDFRGKANELMPLFGIDGLKAKRILLVGLGKRASANSMTLTRSAASAARAISDKKRGTVLFCIPDDADERFPIEKRAECVACGVLLGIKGQDLYRTERVRHPMDRLLVRCPEEDKDAVERGIARGKLLGESVNLARELIDRPPGEIFPESFCERALALAREFGLEAEVLGPDALARLGMHCILGVGAGSRHTPRLLVLRYRGGAKEATTLGFVGKGITFDSGGLSLKTADQMGDMKCDMAGAATVLAAALAIARLAVPVNLLAICALAENMPSGTAIRPGDVLTAKNKKTIEVVNTDAEGRLVLADALCHAVELGASHLVDLATLTGSCMVALGMRVGGLMSNDAAWQNAVKSSAERTGEPAWPLPMFSEYAESIKSKIADMKNSGGRWGGAITAAKLLEEFVGDVPWTHVDIAGPAYANEDAPYQDAGGTGYFVRTLVDLAEHYE